MSTSPTPLGKLALRPVAETDRSFLLDLFDARHPDTSWPDDTTRLDAFRRELEDLAQRFPGAGLDVVLAEEIPIGRLLIERGGDELRVHDFILHPDHQGQSEALVRHLVDEARRDEIPILLQLARHMPGRRAAQRLGFRHIADRGDDVLLRWSPPASAPVATKSMIKNFKLLDLLPELEPDEQLAVFERVIRSPRPQVRQRALGLGAAILSENRLLKYLKEEDDVRRNAAVEMLKLRRKRSLELACHLLEDPNPDVALQAVLVLSHLRDRKALEPLTKALDHEDPNIVQEAILALGRLGDTRALPYILKKLDAIPWVQAAAVEALGRLGSSKVVPHLAELLEKPMLAPLAVEAMAKIGGVMAFEALAEHWTAHGEQFEPAFALRRLADMLEGLTCAPPKIRGFRDALRKAAKDHVKEVRLAATRCLVALKGRRGHFMF